MLKTALILLAAVYITSETPYYIYEASAAAEEVCLTGIYSGEDTYAGLESRSVPQDIYITYLTQGEDFPQDFMTLCSLRDKIPLIVLRPTDYSTEYIDSLASHLAGCNTTVFLQIDSSLSHKSREFFRSCADKIHQKAPETVMVWGISDERAESLSSLYPGDSYVDRVALNIFESADSEGINIDPYPVYHILSYFEKSKPIMLNISVASYTLDGHKYFTPEAAKEIERLYSLALESPSITAISYISKATSLGDARLTNSSRLFKALKRGCTLCKGGGKRRIPLGVYSHNGSFYCDRGVIPTEDEYCIINNKRCYKIKNAGRYIFTRPQ